MLWQTDHDKKHLSPEQRLRAAALIAVLAVVLAGKGMAALQEAGLVGVSPLDGWPRSPVLGVYPTLESMLAQGVMVALLVVGFLFARRQRLN